MKINGKTTYIGSSDNEIDCAKFINQKCVELGLEKRFPELDCLKPPEKKKKETAKVTILFVNVGFLFCLFSETVEV